METGIDRLKFHIFNDEKDFGYVYEEEARDIAKSLKDDYTCEVCEMLTNGKVKIVECTNIKDIFGL